MNAGVVHRAVGRHRRAFTLLEMMLVVAIVGVMSSLAVPSLTGVVRAQQERTVVEQIATVLAEARARAGAENRCYRVRATKPSNLVVERRNSVDCINLDRDGWDAPVRTFDVPASFRVKTETVSPVATSSGCPAVTASDPGGACDLIFRPSGRLRGSGLLTGPTPGARINLLRVNGASTQTVSTIDVEAIGRVCSADRKNNRVHGFCRHWPGIGAWG
jgi:prepilin-type N-terminal cleavage/methylation domain-containing protein